MELAAKLALAYRCTSAVVANFGGILEAPSAKYWLPLRPLLAVTSGPAFNFDNWALSIVKGWMLQVSLIHENYTKFTIDCQYK
jgi:hypothetical protein